MFTNQNRYNWLSRSSSRYFHLRPVTVFLQRLNPSWNIFLHHNRFIVYLWIDISSTIFQKRINSSKNFVSNGNDATLVSPSSYTPLVLAFELTICLPGCISNLAENSSYGAIAFTGLATYFLFTLKVVFTSKCAFFFSHGFSIKFYFMSGVDQAIENGVSQRRIADLFMPVFYR